jgi:hypothetical protein
VAIVLGATVTIVSLIVRFEKDYWVLTFCQIRNYTDQRLTQQSKLLRHNPLEDGKLDNYAKLRLMREAVKQALSAYATSF